MKKKTIRLTRLPLLGSVMLLGACHKEGISDSNVKPSTNTSASADDSDLSVTYDGKEVENGANLEITIGSTTGQIVVDGATATFSSSDDSVLAVDQHSGLLNPKKAGTAVITVDGGASGKLSLNFTVKDVSLATGIQSYATENFDERAKILGSLEKYAVDNYLTGITRFSNGSYVCYNSRYVPTPKEYISGYGWGTRREGKLKSKIGNLTSGGDPWHYQIATSSLPQHANARNGSGSDISDFDAYISSSYYGTRLNSQADGYEWVPVLAQANCPRPIAIGDDENPNDATLNRRWRIYVRTGENAPKYASGSQKGAYSKFNGTEVKLEDYLTRLKFRLTRYNGRYRGAEITTGVSGITGAANYYNHTSQKPSDGAIWNDELWDKYRTNAKNLFVGTDKNGEYIEFNLLYPCTQFYARYYLSSNLYAPLPKEFLKLVGTDYGQNLKSDKNTNATDTTLSVGPYYIKDWKAGDHIYLEKNTGYHEKVDKYSDGTTRDIYQIKGFDWQLIGSQNSISQQRFLDGQTDSYSPDKDALKSGSFGSNGVANPNGGNDKRQWKSYKTKADSNFKINVNATTEEQWNKFFGTNGSVYKHDSSVTASQYTVFYLSNKHFLNFLSYGLDRQTICASRGRTPTQEYLSDNYLIDPENSTAYNSTEAHKAVLADRYNDTYGYNADAAENELALAMEDVIIPNKDKLKTKNNSGVAGTSANPYRITLDRKWMNSGDVKSYGDVFDSWTKIANDFLKSEYGGSYEFAVNQIDGTASYNDVYDARKRGEFQLGFGAVSGNALDPLSFFEVLKSDNSSSFTLNWGPDTSEVSDSIVYDGKKWSYDGLWKAGTTVAALDNEGRLAQIKNVSNGGTTKDGRKYQSLDKTKRAVTYALSFKGFTDAGAVIKELFITVGSKTYSTASLSETGATDKAEVTAIFGEQGVHAITSANPNLNVTLTNVCNKDDDGNNTDQIVLTVSYSITVNGIAIDSEETIKLQSYISAVKK